MKNLIFYIGLLMVTVFVAVFSYYNQSFVDLLVWGIALGLISIWGTLVRGSIHQGAWWAIGMWLVALVVQQILAISLQWRNGSLSNNLSLHNHLVKHDIHQIILGLLFIVPGIPVAYLVSWLTWKIKRATTM